MPADLTPEDAARLLADSCCPGPWRSTSSGYVLDADSAWVARASDAGTSADLRLAAAAPDLCALVARQAARIRELEAPGEGQSLHKLRARLMEVAAERDEALAAVQAEHRRTLHEADADVRESERHHAGVVQTAMAREAALREEVERLRDTLNWTQEQCPGKCAGVVAAALVTAKTPNP